MASTYTRSLTSTQIATNSDPTTPDGSEVDPPQKACLSDNSMVQPGSSGRGPTKRKRRDNSASSSTIQGDVKRVRVHSTQRETRIYARATKDIPARLAVAICCSPPSRDLTHEEAEEVKVGLENLLLDSDSITPLPAFRGYPREAKGTVQIWCEDDDALTWLAHNVPLLRLPDPNLRLTVLKQSEMPTRVRASLFVPRFRGDIQKLHRVLIRQNLWCDMASWSLYRATTVGGENYGTYLTLGVPPLEVKKVLSRERRISYLLGSIYVRIWPTTESSDCGTGPMTTTLTETRMDDTDIAEEDDEDARSPTTSGWSEQLLASSPGDQHDQYRDEAGEGCCDISLTD